MRVYLVFILSLMLNSVAIAQGFSPGIEKTIVAASPLTGVQLADANGKIADSTRDDSVSLVETSGQYKSRWLTGNKVHKYLGIGSIGAAALTLLTIDSAEDGEGSSSNVDGGIHETFARTATALGGAAVLTGLIFHWDDIQLSNGISDPDNLHLLLTTLGTLGYAKAVDQAPGESHSGYGSIGAASMILGIKMVW